MSAGSLVQLIEPNLLRIAVVVLLPIHLRCNAIHRRTVDHVTGKTSCKYHGKYVVFVSNYFNVLIFSSSSVFRLL